MKLLSDFDGVWTDPEAEAKAQGECLEQTLLEWTAAESRAAARQWLDRARECVRQEPTRYGWAPGGRLSAFGDEDPFAPHSALLHYLGVHAPKDPVARELKAAILSRGFDTIERFGGHMHAEGVARVARTHGPGILPAATQAGLKLLARGIEVVVVSNSGTEKLARWFGHAELPHTVHPESKPGRIRLRGAARKFELDADVMDLLEVGVLRIDVARPAYAAILLTERPDAVVGDVFSLDLALPLALKRRHAGWGGVALFWLVQPYTPAWLRSEVERATAGEVEPIEGGLGALADQLAARSEEPPQAERARS